VERDVFREASVARLRSELEHRFEVGGPEEAGLRALIYIRLPEGSVDERGFSVLKLVRASRPAARRRTLAQVKEIIREQYLLVRLDEERAINALPTLLGADATERKAVLDVVHQVGRGGVLSGRQSAALRGSRHCSTSSARSRQVGAGACLTQRFIRAAP
jgi:hypothetical protein